jgi:4'-phosphopantetheinyl transferase
MLKQPYLDQTIHIWHADLAAHIPHLAVYWTWLSASEKARASHLIAPQQRSLFVCSRGLLRQQLAHYLDQSPESIVLTTNENGKPLLAGAKGSVFTFNLSHSKNKTAFIFALKRKVGIDIEYKSSRKWIEKIAHRFFSQTEYQQLKTKTGQEKLNFFFDRWVAHEAAIKACGQSLFSHPDAKYSTVCNHLTQLSKPLTIVPLTLDTDFAAAAAIEAYDPSATPLLIREIT